MKINFQSLIDLGVIENNKLTELFVNGNSVWKGLSEELVNFDKLYKFIDFDNTKTNAFNEAAYKINVQPINHIFVEDKKTFEQEMEYGLPEDKKYPLYDKAHVLSAIKFFNYCKEPEKQEILAKAIIAKMKKYGIPSESVGPENKLKGFLTVIKESFDAEEESPEGIKLHDDGDGKGKYFYSDDHKKVYPENHELDENMTIRNGQKKGQEVTTLDGKPINMPSDFEGKMLKTKGDTVTVDSRKTKIQGVGRSASKMKQGLLVDFEPEAHINSKVYKGKQVTPYIEKAYELQKKQADEIKQYKKNQEKLKKIADEENQKQRKEKEIDRLKELKWAKIENENKYNHKEDSDDVAPSFLKRKEDK